MAIDLRNIEGLTEEQKTAIAQANVLDVAGLKKNNADLLAEKQATKTKAEQAEQAKIEAQEKAAQEKAASNGNTEELKKLIVQQAERLTNQQKEFDTKHRESALSNQVKDLINSHVVRDDPAAAMFMESIFKKNLGIKEGQLVHTSNGVETGMDVKEHLKGILADQRNSKYLVGTKANGGGANGGSGNGGAGAKTMTEADHNALAAKDPQAASDFFLRDKGQIVG